MIPVLLYPAPRRRTAGSGTFVVPVHGRITVDAGADERILAAASRLARSLAPGSGRPGGWDVATTEDGRGGEIALRLVPGGRPEGYVLDVTSVGTEITAGDDAGLWSGLATLRQLLRAGEEELPAERIEDWPEWAHRAAMLDVSRDRVPTMETLFRLVDELAGWKYNELQLYTEHTFAYRGHEAVWRDASPLTAEEVVELDGYCRARFVTLVPNQNTLGHLHKWLEHPAYAPLAENYPYERPAVAPHVMHRGVPFWGDVPYSVCPTDPAAQGFVLGLLDELLPNFTARSVHIGLDEPFDLGTGRSRAAGGSPQSPRLFLDFLNLVHRHLAATGRTVQIWGDFLAEHPESVAGLPADVVVVDWGYWLDYPFAERAARLAGAGLTFRIATGTNAWCSLGGRTHTTRVHMEAATEAARQHGAEGLMVTDWGWFEHGTYQQHPISYPGLLRGAGEAWSPDESRAVPFAAALSRHALGDPSGELGTILLDLGDIAPGGGPEIVDNSPLYWAMREDLGWLRERAGLSPADARQAVADLEEIDARLARAGSTRDDAGWLLDELALTVGLLRHGARRYLVAAGDGTGWGVAPADELDDLLTRFEQTWRRRYRSGGLAGTLDRLRQLGQDYGSATDPPDPAAAARTGAVAGV